MVSTAGLIRCLDTLSVRLSRDETDALLRCFGFSAHGDLPLSVLRDKLNARKASKDRVCTRTCLWPCVRHICREICMFVCYIASQLILQYT